MAQFVPGDLNDARMRQQHAADHAQMLYYYSQMPQPPKAKVQEHAVAVKENTAAALKSLAKVKAVDPKDAELQKRATAIKAILKKCEQECEMISQHVADEKGDAVKVCACCSNAHEHLHEAMTETDKLMKDLGIKKVEISKAGAKKKEEPKK